MNYNEVLFFFIFLTFILTILFIDLGLFSKRVHIVRFNEALKWTVLWIALSVGFYFLIRTHGEWIHGIKTIDDIKYYSELYQHPISITSTNFDEALSVYKNNLSLEYLTGYLIEYALSVDNVFVMVLIFLSFGVRQVYFKRVLFWGILGAIVMRFLFIFASAALIHQFYWVLYLFGLLLIFTGIKMFMARNKVEHIEPNKHPVVKFASKYFHVFPRFVKHHFVIKKKNGAVYITPLLLVLLVIEFTDVIFAVDSVPAIFSVTKDPYIVFFSNIFAILGLRSLFFLVMNAMNKFRYLKVGLSVLLVFIGVKMLVNDWLKDIGFSTAHSLYIVLAILFISVLASLLPSKKIAG